MKRVSISTNCSHGQNIKNQLAFIKDANNSSKQFTKQNNQLKINLQETDISENRLIFSLQNHLFKDCYQNNKNNKQSQNTSTYHKLRYQRLNEHQQQVLRKNQKQKQLKLIFQKQKTITQIKALINQQTQKLDKSKTFSFIKSHIQEHLIQKLPKTFDFQKENHHKFLQQNHLSTQMKLQNYRLSTLDSYRMKSYLQQTLKSTNPYFIQAISTPFINNDPTRLQNLSKLCESVDLQNIHFNTERCISTQKFIKPKPFLRSQIPSTKKLQSTKNHAKNSKNKAKKQNYVESLWMIENDEQVYMHQCQNQDQQQNLASVKTIKLQSNQHCLLDRFKTLAQCGNTIVSRYNKSSQKKSRLSESSIIFQASKDVDEQLNTLKQLKQKQNKNFVCSQVKNNNTEYLDQQIQNAQKQMIVSVEQIEQNMESLLFLQQISPISSMKKQNKMVKNRGFSKLQKKSPFLRKNQQNQEIQDIRFDLDTYIEYGPL